MYDQRATQLVQAPRSRVYAALLDPAAVGSWRVPDDMTAHVHQWDPVVGGRFRVSLTYRDPDRAGKSARATDTYAGTFVRLERDELVVERLSFVTADETMRGTMTMTWTLRDAASEQGPGTEVELLHAGVPDAVPAEDNAAGTRMALAALAAYVEGAGRPGA